MSGAPVKKLPARPGVGILSVPVADRAVKKSMQVSATSEAGWVLLHVYTREAGESFPSQFPCFVIGWPRELSRKPKPQAATQESLGRS
jgi:hypothetical protein